MLYIYIYICDYSSTAVLHVALPVWAWWCATLRLVPTGMLLLVWWRGLGFVLRAALHVLDVGCALRGQNVVRNNTGVCGRGLLWVILTATTACLRVRQNRCRFAKHKQLMQWVVFMCVYVCHSRRQEHFRQFDAFFFFLVDGDAFIIFSILCINLHCCCCVVGGGCSLDVVPVLVFYDSVRISFGICQQVQYQTQVKYSVLSTKSPRHLLTTVVPAWEASERIVVGHAGDPMSISPPATLLHGTSRPGIYIYDTD